MFSVSAFLVGLFEESQRRWLSGFTLSRVENRMAVTVDRRVGAVKSGGHRRVNRKLRNSEAVQKQPQRKQQENLEKEQQKQKEKRRKEPRQPNDDKKDPKWLAGAIELLPHIAAKDLKSTM